MSANSRAQSQKRICEKCGRREGGVYSFHYGKRKSRTTQRDGNRYIYTTSFHVAGKKDAVACNGCIWWRRVLEAIPPVLGIAVCALFGWWVFFQEGLVGLGKPEKEAVLTWMFTAFACIGILMGIHGLYSKLFGSKDGPGERLIIALKRGELQRQGFDSFWDTASYSRLR
jgi:hypothetical protein